MDLIFQLVILIFSVVVHEVSHGYAALLQGDHTAEYQGRLTLNPLKHLDPIGSFVVPLMSYLLGGFIIGWARPVPFNPYNLRNRRWGEALVAVAGPLSNVCIALIFSFIIRFGSVSLPASFIQVSSVIVFINILLAVFNLIPVPPLDGSKILFSFFPLNFASIRIFFERYSLVLVLIFIFFLWQYIAPVASYFFHVFTGLS